MRNIILVLIGISILSFLLAVISTLSGGHLINLPSETYSRACNNLALVAIALSLRFGKMTQ